VAASVALPVRSIVADASRLGSVGVVLAHNHPSGDAQPSVADCRATRALSQAGEAIDLTVLDHLIFGADGHCNSMRRMGLL
jgi:DNA repair protein RadC